MRRSLWLITLILAAGSVCAQTAPPEFRACYVTRFQWPSPNRAEAEGNIRQMLQTLADHNFNAVLFQIRGQCDVNYPSPYEPWGSVYNWQDPGFDPVAFAVEEAHRLGLEFHAYINTHVITPSGTIPPPVTQPQHLYNLHARPGVAESWVIHGEDGQPDFNAAEYVWMSPGIPEASVWTRRAVLHVVETYDVDGVHFDRIRTPGPQYSHDPITEARFRGEGNPDNLDWGDFMRAQITQDLARIRGAIHRVRPEVVISAAPFGINRRLPGGYQGTGTESYHRYYQDSFTWMEEHVLDMMFPMIYWGIGSAHPFEVLFHDFMQHTGDRHMCVAFNREEPADVVACIEEVRRQGGAGSSYWVHGRVPWETFDAVYAEPAPIPERTWQTNPTTGMIVGWVTDSGGNPVVDARINLLGDPSNHLTGGDGFYTILDVTPGTHSLVVNHSGFQTGGRTGVTVGLGDVVEVHIALWPQRGADE